MRLILNKILILLFLGTVLHLIFIIYYPTYKMWELNRKRGGETTINKVFHADIINSNSRDVIKPSPDLLYSGCSYDVTYSPLIITSEVLDSYWSISFYASNSDNFALMNDMDIQDKNIKIYLFGPNSKPIKITDGYAIFSPSNKGAMLIRRFIGNEMNIDELYLNQDTLTCSSLNN